MKTSTPHSPTSPDATHGGESPMTVLTLDVDLETQVDALPADLPEAGDYPLPCWTASPDLWFAESPADVETAKALCVSCPLREACLAGALERKEPWGVWGGQLVLDGVVVPRKRPRGRPRKADALAYAAAIGSAA